MEDKKNNNYWIMVLTLFLGYTMIYTDKMTIGIAMVPIGKEFALTATQKGYVLSSFFLGYSIFQVPMAYLATSKNTKFVLMMSMAAMAVFMVLFGVTPVPIFMMMVVIRFFSASIAHAPYPASSSRMLAVHVPLEERTLPQAILIGSSGFATFAGSLILSRVYNGVGWRFGFIIMAVVAVIVCAVMFFTLPDTKPDVTAKTEKKKDGVKFSTIISTPLVWFILLSSLFFNACMYGLSGFLPSYLQEERGLDIIDSGNVMAVCGLASFIASIVGGFLIGKYLKGKEKLVIFWLSVISAVCIYAMYLIDNMFVVTLLLGIAQALMVLVFITITSLPLKIFPKETVAPYYATINAGGVSGGFFAPIVMGKLFDMSGNYSSSFVFLTALAVLCGVSILFVKNSVIEAIYK